MKTKYMHEFTKAQALGNDFIIMDNLSNLSVDSLRFLSNRRLGIGADQLISFEDYNSNNLDFAIRFYNSDGSTADACGNGSRAAAGFYSKKTGKSEFRFGIYKSDNSLSVSQVNIDDGYCKISMERPHNINGTGQVTKHIKTDYGQANYINIGNPHIVFTSSSIKEVPIEEYGSKLQNNFDGGINAEWIEILSEHKIRMIVFERGAGITPSCGTGACASAITAILKHNCVSPVTVKCDGGDLEVFYEKQTNTLSLKGEYKIVFHGEIDL